MDSEPTELAAAIGRELWDFVRAQSARDAAFRLQLDEPCLGLAMTDDDARLLEAAYAERGRPRACRAARSSPSSSGTRRPTR